MRLRLNVRRYGLPAANILWNSNGLHALPQDNGNTPTIAQFLIQVNEVIPLESEDWGLEDYVVEVGGYECVHFSTLNNLFSQDDEIVYVISPLPRLLELMKPRIRPLELNDRRSRRVSGRIQIAADGRKLYDGVAFGRPLLRRIQRPSVRIPSVKRARITYGDEDNEEVELPNPNQLILRDEDADEDDIDYAQHLSAHGITGLAAHKTRHSNGGHGIAQADGQLVNARKRQRAGLGIEEVKVSPSVVAEDSSFSSRLRSFQQSRRSSNTRESPKNVRFDTDELETPATILDTHETEDEEDEDFDFEQADSDDDTDDSVSNKENVAPSVISRKIQYQEQRGDLSSSTEETSSSGSDSESQSESDSSSDSNGDSEAESDVIDDKNLSGAIASGNSNSPSSSSETSDSSSDSGASISNSESEAVSKSQPQDLLREATTSMQTQDPSSNGKIRAPPGMGTKITRKRNARRKIRKHFLIGKKIKAQGDLNSSEALQDQLVIQQTENNLESRRIQLLEDLGHTEKQANVPTKDTSQTSPLPLPKESATNDLDTSTKTTHADESQSSPAPEVESSRGKSASIQSHIRQDSSANADTKSKDIDLEAKATVSRRSRLDLGSAKRMLFGSLGLRAPRSKDDANKLRDKLEAKAQKLPGNMIGPVQPTAIEESTINAIVDKNDESWKNSIDLRAVECCYDGVEYSAPPFPFVQRWDPMQQYNTKRKSRGGGGRNKRQKRNNQKYYQDEEAEGYQDYNGYNESFANDSYQALAETTSSRPREAKHDQDNQAANEQLLGEDQIGSVSAGGEEDKFPELPLDMSALPTLEIGNARPGNFIVFKQMEMSEHTAWCPVISAYRTAKIENILDDGLLAVRLAEGDVVAKERNYDPETGERVYSKFEMPDDEEDEQDDRYLEIGLQDMIEPRLLKEVQDSGTILNPLTAVGAAIGSMKSVISSGQEMISAVLKSGDAQEQDTRLLDDAEMQDAEANKYQQDNNQPADLSQKLKHNIVTRFETPAREASIELGSHNPPTRFFSELRSSQNPAESARDRTIATSSNVNDMPSYDHNSRDIISEDEAVDDPSLWQPASESMKQEEQTQYFSPLSGKADQMAVSSQHKEDAITILSTTEPAMSQHELEHNTVVVSEQIDLSSSQQADMDEETMENGEGEATNDELDKTLMQDSVEVKLEVSKNKSSATLDYSESNSDLDSSSLPSLKDLLSQPGANQMSPTKAMSKKDRKGAYPKISDSPGETSESFIFSQAPKRLLSDTHKIAIDMEAEDDNDDDDYLSRDTDKRSSKGPYELEALTGSSMDVKSEDDEPELPEITANRAASPLADIASASPRVESKAKTRTNRDSLFVRPPFKRPPASQPTPSSRDNPVVDLTLSSDPMETGSDTTPKRKQPARRVASSMSSGPGWVGNGSVKGASIANGKSPKRSLKRTKSSI